MMKVKSGTENSISSICGDTQLTGQRKWIALRLFICTCILFGISSFPAVAQTDGTSQADPFVVFDQAHSSYVMVAAHRAGYQSNGVITHPENSLSAAHNSIELGVDILEIDVRMTSDGGLVVMHDSSVNRTTNGSGQVSQMTLAQVTSLRLHGPNGLTNEHVPTLAEFMEVARGNVLVNLDKVDITNGALVSAIMQTLQDTETVEHAIFKGGATASQVASLRSTYGDSVIYMPLLSNRSETTMLNTLQSHAPPAIELIFNSSSTGMLSENSLESAGENDTHVWINSLWSSLNAGHHDAVAIGGNPDGSWGWLVEHGATIIQTDNAPQLISYLESLELRTFNRLGDLNSDGYVGAEDMDILLANWGDTVSIGDLSLGDSSGDGVVGNADLNVVLQHWGEGTPPDVNIPEPTSALGFGALMFAIMRRP